MTKSEIEILEALKKKPRVTVEGKRKSDAAEKLLKRGLVESIEWVGFLDKGKSGMALGTLIYGYSVWAKGEGK